MSVASWCCHSSSLQWPLYYLWSKIESRRSRFVVVEEEGAGWFSIWSSFRLNSDSWRAKMLKIKEVQSDCDIFILSHYLNSLCLNSWSSQNRNKPKFTNHLLLCVFYFIEKDVLGLGYCTQQMITVALRCWVCLLCFLQYY